MDNEITQTPDTEPLHVTEHFVMPEAYVIEKQPIPGGDGVPFALPFDFGAPVAHTNIMQAIGETNQAIGQVRMDVRGRDCWLYLVTDEAPEWAASFFGRPGSPTMVGTNAVGLRCIAVWNRDGEPDTAPELKNAGTAISAATEP